MPFFLSCHNRKLCIIVMLLSVIVLLQGCFSSKKDDSESYGFITGTLTEAANSHIIASSGNNDTVIRVENDGRFSAKLTPGLYQLYMNITDDKIQLIKSDIQIDNNITVSLVNADLVPIPQVLSVTVPLVYSDSVVIEWESDIESDGHVEYGNNELYGYSSYAATDLKKSHRLQIYNLLPATTYHFRIVASRHNLESSRSLSRNFTFITEP